MKVAITGGTGTLGQALTRRLLKMDAERIVVFSRDEVKQAMMAMDLGLTSQDVTRHDSLRFMLGDVRDRARLVDAFYGCDTVVHAAALKRVDAVAYNPTEVRKTNIEGSANVVSAAIESGVKRVLMISSDKACQPTNIYGVTKAAMEHEAIASNVIGYPRGTRISVLRYGNVLGSRGSVVHLWRQAVAEGRPIPLTDRRMTRFWLTIDQAVDLVEDTLTCMTGGEIFVPWLSSLKLTDLAAAIAPGHPINEMGLRPGGEKLHEILMTHDEATRSRSTINGLYIIIPAQSPWTRVRWEDWPEGVPTELRSDTAQQLSTYEIRKMLEGV